jgi:carotene biosynthesis associated membrane protein
VASSTLPGAAGSLTARASLPFAARQFVPLGLAALTVLSQIAYPLSSGDFRDRLTVTTVVLWCAASLTHAAITRGPRYAAALLAVTAGVGYGAELLGIRTGFPFGSYSYTATLGPRLGGVPIVVPLAWAMMAYPALLVGRRIGAPVITGAIAFASWDLFLDPQMVAAGHWRFTGAGPLVNGIPVSNTVGWIGVALLIMVLLVRIPERAPGRNNGETSIGEHDDRAPLGLYLWTYASSTLAAAAFFHRPGVALVGGLAMGVPVVLLLTTLRTTSFAASRDRPA